MKRSGDISESPPKHVGNKAIILNYDFVEGLFDADGTCLYCLTNKQVQILIALLPYIGWRTRWESPSGAPIDQDELDQLEAGLGAALMSDVCSEIMAKLNAIEEKADSIITKVDAIKTLEDTIHTEMMELKTDLDVSQTAQDVEIALILTEITATVEPALALLTTSIAGIAALLTTTSHEVHDVHIVVDDVDDIISDPTDGLAEVSEDVDNIELLVQKIKSGVTNVLIQNNVTVVNNFLLTFSSATSDTTDTQQYARWNALCSTVLNWMKGEAYVIMEALGAPVPDLDDIKGLMDIYSLATLYILTAPDGTYYDETSIHAAFTDSAAMYDVACPIITYLRDRTVSAANFQAALSSYTPPALPDHRKIIYDTLQIALADFDGYNAFVNLLPVAYDDALALNPTSFDCPPCGALASFCGFPNTWDFTTGAKVPWLINRGELQLGVGIVGSQIPGDLNFGVDMSIYFGTGGCAALNGHHVEFDHAHIAAVTNAWTIEFYSVNLTTGAIVKYNTSNRSQTAAWPAVDVDSIVIPTPVAGTALYRIRFYANTPFYGNATNQPSTASKITTAKLLT